MSWWFGVLIMILLSNYRWVNFDKGKDIDYLPNDVYGVGDRDIIVMLMPENKVHIYNCAYSPLSFTSLILLPLLIALLSLSSLPLLSPLPPFLPGYQVCRYVCNPKERDSYYVWHTFAIKENR